MFVLIRTLVFSTLFISFVLVYAPARILAWSGLVRPGVIGVPQVVGMAVGCVGAAVALWCVATFALMGKGTPAPFDPPRRLVVKGPYRFVRNPMYLGAALALSGAALFYGSWWLLGYVGLFLLATHSFVVGYEEPVLRRRFGQDYEAYCRGIGRWWPRIRTTGRPRHPGP